MNAELIGREKYEEYNNSFERKIQEMSEEQLGELFKNDDFGPSTGSGNFNGPFTIAIDIDGSVYDE